MATNTILGSWLGHEPPAETRAGIPVEELQLEPLSHSDLTIAVRAALEDLTALRRRIGLAYLTGDGIGLDGVCRRLDSIINTLTDFAPTSED